jgi:hypothetical protein
MFPATFRAVKQAIVDLLSARCNDCSAAGNKVRATRIFSDVLPARIQCHLSQKFPGTTIVTMDVLINVQRIIGTLTLGNRLLISLGLVLCLAGTLAWSLNSPALGVLVAATGALLVGFAILIAFFCSWSLKMEKADSTAVDFCKAFWIDLEKLLSVRGIPCSAHTSFSVQVMHLNLLLGILFLLVSMGLLFYVSIHSYAPHQTTSFALLALLALFAPIFLRLLVFQQLRGLGFRYEWKEQYFENVWDFSMAVALPLWGLLLFLAIPLIPDMLASDARWLLWSMIILFEYGGLALWLSKAERADAETISNRLLPSSAIEARWNEQEFQPKRSLAMVVLYLNWFVVSIVVLSATIPWTAMLCVNAYCFASSTALTWPRLIVNAWSGYATMRVTLWLVIATLVICLPQLVALCGNAFWNQRQRLRIRRKLPPAELAELPPSILDELRHVHRQMKVCLQARSLWLICGSVYSRTMVRRVSLTKRDYVIAISKIDLCRPRRIIEAILWHECGHVAYADRRPFFRLFAELLPWGNTFRWLCSDSIEEELWCDAFCIKMMGNNGLPLRHALEEIQTQNGHWSDDQEPPHITGAGGFAWRALTRILGAGLSPYYHPQCDIRLAHVNLYLQAGQVSDQGGINGANR